MLFKSRCYNGGKQHRFNARYSTESKPTIIDPPVMRGDVFDIGVAVERIIEASRHVKEEYVHDVCEWCGTIAGKRSDV